MYIDCHYPFEVLPLCFNPSLIKDFSCCGVFAYHHQDIYKRSVEKLNLLLANYPDFHHFCLEELIFNQKYLPENIKNDVVFFASKVYNHQIFFNSLCNNSYLDFNLDIVKKLIDKYGNIEEFYKHFINTSMNFRYSGYVWVVCDNKKDVFIYITEKEDTLIEDNLYQLFGIDLWEHSYICCTDKKSYVCTFLNNLNWLYINNEYLEAIKKL